MLNGLGYLLLAWAYYGLQLAARKSMVRKIYLGFTAITILFYGLSVALSGDWSLPLGPIDKIVEIILLVQFWQDKA